MSSHFRILPLAALAAALGACTTSGTPAPVEAFDTEGAQVEVVVDPNAPIQRPGEYTVAAGDTLVEISARYGLDYREVARWNLITNPDRIEIGQKLKLVPPRYEPEVGSVVPQITEKRQPDAVRPQLRRTTETEAQAIREAPERPTDKAAPSVRRKQTIIGQRPATDESAPRLLVSTPSAVKLPYSEQALASMRGGSTGKAVPASLPAASAPRGYKQQAGIQWSWPTTGSIAAEFSDESKGVNIAAERGTPVHASANGEIIYVGSGIKGLGQVVIVRHKDEYVSVYAHNDTIFVAEGDKVERGNAIAAMGDTGARQVGLHFQIRRGSKHFNPLDFLPPSP